MYKNILVPVDLEHKEQVEKALTTAVDLAKLYDGSLTVVGVTMSGPSAVARNPEESETKLAEYASDKAKQSGTSISSKVMLSHDPTIDIDNILQKAISELNSDLVVMASHVPGLKEYVLASRAGYLASHAEISVMVVR